MHENTQKMAEIVNNVAEDICNRLHKLTGDDFLRDPWERTDHYGDPGGGGITRIFKQGKHIEGGAVNTSVIKGHINPEFAKKLKSEDSYLEAAGVSLIIHPVNPHAPTVHMNFRYIRQGEKQWFGGGADLTPYLPNTEKFKFFHQFWKDKLDAFAENFYPQMKEECDKYFYIPHRKEMRGIGGIFYDYVEVTEQNWKMIESLATSFIDSYLPIFESTFQKEYTTADRDFQLYRRGRYVEFNLIYDRGTIFGLKTNGRIESILASLPPNVRYEYMHEPQPGTPYAEMIQYYQPHDWVNFST